MKTPSRYHDSGGSIFTAHSLEELDFHGPLARWTSRFMLTLYGPNSVTSWSKDPDEKVGCIIVSPDKRQLSWGFNGLPSALRDTDIRLRDKELKNRLTVHAELNALLNARRDLTGWHLFVTKAPCTKCAVAIMQAGIVSVTSPSPDPKSRWHLDQEDAAYLLMEAGLHVVHIEYDMEHDT
jgi:dCMP deaminase